MRRLKASSSLAPEQENTLCSYQEIVFARMTPEQRLRIVRSMQAGGSVVSATGNDVNNAPVLHAADCGITMGSGSEVVCEAPDTASLRTSLLSLSLWSMVCLFYLSKPTGLKLTRFLLPSQICRPSGNII